MESVATLRVLESHRLELTFDTGEVRIFDATPYLEMDAFRRLKDPALFARALVGFGTVCWPGDLDIAPETLYDRSRAIETHL